MTTPFASSPILIIITAFLNVSPLISLSTVQPAETSLSYMFTLWSSSLARTAVFFGLAGVLGHGTHKIRTFTLHLVGGKVKIYHIGIGFGPRLLYKLKQHTVRLSTGNNIKDQHLFINSLKFPHKFSSSAGSHGGLRRRKGRLPSIESDREDSAR